MTAVSSSPVVLPKHDGNSIEQGEEVAGQREGITSEEEKSASSAPSSLSPVLEAERWVLKGTKLWFCPLKVVPPFGPLTDFFVSPSKQDKDWYAGA